MARKTDPLFYPPQVPHCTVDVNVHPTKREVRFLFQDEIVERLVEILSTVLDNANVTRIFHVGQVGPPGGGDVTETETDTRATEKVTTRTQALLPGASRPGAESPEDDGPGLGNASLVTVDPTTGDPQWTQPSKKPKTNSTRDQVARDHKLVRVDAAQTNLSLELFFHRADKETDNAVRVGTDGNGTAADFGVGATPLPPPADTAMAEHEENVFLAERRAASAATSATDAIPDGATSSLSSVKTLWGEITREAHAGLTKVLRNAVLVGSLPPGSSSKQHLCLVQHKTKLHVVNMQILQREFWYQRIIARFGTFSVTRLAEPAIVETLVVLALETEAVDGFPDSEVRAFQDTESHADDMDTCATADAFHDSEPTNDMATQCPEKLAAAKAVADLLFEKADMLREYFGVEFVRDGNGVTALIGLPNLLHGFFPNVNCLPEFITNLAQNVEWKEEKSCFRTVAATLAEFYGGGMGGIDDCDDETENAENDDDENVLGSNVLEDPRNSSRKLVEQRVLFPAIRKFLRPSKISHAQHVLTQVASLEQLYKVFERC
jgi:DNA mismatch repair protein MLH1